MTIQQAIKKAIKGGYRKQETWIKIRLRERPNENEWIGDEWQDVFGELAIRTAVLAPNFWQCLGKASKWGEVKPCPSCDGGRRDFPAFHDPATHQNHPTTCGLCDGTGSYPKNRSDDDWEQHWYDFIGCLAEGKSAEEYFDTIKEVEK